MCSNILTATPSPAPFYPRMCSCQVRCLLSRERQGPGALLLSPGFLGFRLQAWFLPLSLLSHKLQPGSLAPHCCATREAVRSTAQHGGSLGVSLWSSSRSPLGTVRNGQDQSPLRPKAAISLLCLPHGQTDCVGSSEAPCEKESVGSAQIGCATLVKSVDVDLLFVQV